MPAFALGRRLLTRQSDEQGGDTLIKLIIVLAVVVSMGLALVAIFGPKYGRLFDERHLFSELPDVLAHQRDAALSQVGQPIDGPGDPRLQSTSAGLSSAFTAEEIDGWMLIHISLTYGGSPLALAFGARCGFLVLYFLGIDPDRAALAHSRTGYIHIAFLLQPSEVESFRQRPMKTAPMDRIEELKTSAGAWRDDLLSHGRVLRSEKDLLPELVGKMELSNAIQNPEPTARLEPQG